MERSKEDIVIRFIHSIEDSDAFIGKGSDIEDFALMIVDKDLEGMKELLDDKVINLKDFSYEYLNLCSTQYLQTEDEEFLKIIKMFLDYGIVLYDQNDKLFFELVEDSSEAGQKLFDFIYSCYKKNDQKMLNYDPKVQKFKINFDFKKRMLFNALAKNNSFVIDKIKDDINFFSSFRFEDFDFKNKLVTLLINLANNSSYDKANDIFFTIFKHPKMLELLQETPKLKQSFEDRGILTNETMKTLVLYNAL